jgi:site-specific recombinase XerD
MPEEPFAIDAFSTSQAHRESAELEVLAEEFARLSSSPNTVRAYRADWRAFSTWCSKRGYLALPASAHTVILYATHAAAREHLSRATILRRMATIRNVHESRGLPSPVSDPTTRAVLAGIRRTKAASPELARAPVRTEDLRQLLRHVPTDTLPGLRDRALLLLGYALGFTPRRAGGAQRRGVITGTAAM